MKKLLLAIGLCSFIACSKDKTLPDTEQVPATVTDVSQKPPPPIDPGPGGPVVQPDVTYLIPTGPGTYVCHYAGIQISISSVTYPLSGPPTNSFNDYGTYYTQEAYGEAAVLPPSNASGGGWGHTFTFTESYCAGFEPPSLCSNWQTRTLAAALVKVLNPPPTAPSFLALVPPNYFLL